MGSAHRVLQTFISVPVLGLPMLVVALLLELLLVLDLLHLLAITADRLRFGDGVADGQAEDENGRLHLQVGEI